ncbi:hypothetical protein ACFQ0M_44015 [Kitasatospora aburaviensis]
MPMSLSGLRPGFGRIGAAAAAGLLLALSAPGVALAAPGIWTPPSVRAAG